jgi:hypothetical protein
MTVALFGIKYKLVWNAISNLFRRDRNLIWPKKVLVVLNPKSNLPTGLTNMSRFTLVSFNFNRSIDSNFERVAMPQK